MIIKDVPIHKDNQEPRIPTQHIEAVVIHIMQGTLIGTDGWFGGQNIQNGIYSSSHEGIGKNGEVHMYVKTENISYHAGRVNQPIWSGMKKNVFGSYVNPNQYTYGIECEGFRGDMWTEEQMNSLVGRVRLSCLNNNIPFTRSKIISHHEITADKENMSQWCDEVVKRLNQTTPITDKRSEIKKKLQEVLELINSL